MGYAVITEMVFRLFIVHTFLENHSAVKKNKKQNKCVARYLSILCQSRNVIYSAVVCDVLRMKNTI